MSQANNSQELPQVSNTTAEQIPEGSQQPEGSQNPQQHQTLGNRNLTKGALNDFVGPQKQMLQRYLKQGVKEDPAVIFARTQGQRYLHSMATAQNIEFMGGEVYSF